MKDLKDLLGEKEQEDESKKRKTQIAIIAIESISILVLGIFLVYIVTSTVNNMVDMSNKTPKVTVESKDTVKTKKVEKPLYITVPGYTYYTDKGKIKLYADVIPMSPNKLFVIGQLFHEEKPLDDAYIKESFSKQEDGTYANANKDITIIYGDTSISIEDQRGVSLQFDGTLKLVEEIKNKSEDISGDYVEEIVEEIKAENNLDIKVDEYSIETTPENFVSTKFNDYLMPENEQKDYTITAKYIESTTNSGVKYQELYSGTYFYTFGNGFPYDKNSCDTVTITATYRGNESRFNGLSMDNKYPCFVIKSIRKPNENEVSQKITN